MKHQAAEWLGSLTDTQSIQKEYNTLAHGTKHVLEGEHTWRPRARLALGYADDGTRLGCSRRNWPFRSAAPCRRCKRSNVMSGDRHARWLSGWPKPWMYPPMSARPSCRQRGVNGWSNG